MKFQKEFGYCHGRFQPFHNGHLNMVKEALLFCQTLIIGISNPFRQMPVYKNPLRDDIRLSLEKARDLNNNPWPYWARVWIIREGLQQENIELSRIIFMPNLNNSHLPVEEVLFPKEITRIFICPKEAHNKMWLKRYKEDNWDVHEIKNKSTFSATDVRNKIVNDENWEHMVPKGSIAIIRKIQKMTW